MSSIKWRAARSASDESEVVPPLCAKRRDNWLCMIDPPARMQVSKSPQSTTAINQRGNLRARGRRGTGGKGLVVCPDRVLFGWLRSGCGFLLAPAGMGCCLRLYKKKGGDFTG